jgi:cell division protein FtsW
VADRHRMIRAGHGIALVTLCLLVVGVVFVNSASLSVHGTGSTTLQGLLTSRASVFAALAVACLVAGALVPVDRVAALRGWLNPVPWILLVSVLGVVMTHVPGVGREVNGAHRWIALGPVTFQGSELAKWGLPFALAWWCCRNSAHAKDFWRGFALPLACVGAICVGVAIEDLGTAVLIMLVSIIVLVAAGCRWWHAALLAPVGLVGFVALIVASPYRVNRILAYLNPYEDPQGIGYHVIQSMGAIGGGGLAGRGLGNSIQKFGYLPEGTTDFIYAIICEETGILGAAGVVALYVLLMWCGWMVIGATRREGPAGGSTTDVPALSPFGQLLGLGVLATIGLQALINVAVVTALAPTKGIALPLVSRGGTGWMLTCLALGLLISMDRRIARECGAGCAPQPQAGREPRPEQEPGREPRPERGPLPLV